MYLIQKENKNCALELKKMAKNQFLGAEIQEQTWRLANTATLYALHKHKRVLILLQAWNLILGFSLGKI